MGYKEIIERIRQDTQEEIQQVQKETEEEIQLIETEIEQERKSQLKNIQEEAELIKKRTFEHKIASARSEMRKQILALKQQLLEELFSQAKQHLLNMPDEKYVSRIKKAVDKITDSGTIFIGAKDFQRRGEMFKREFEKGFTVSKTDEIDYGVIIDKGKVRYNLSVDAIFSEGRENLTEKLVNLLFPKD